MSEPLHLSETPLEGPRAQDGPLEPRIGATLCIQTVLDSEERKCFETRRWSSPPSEYLIACGRRKGVRKGVRRGVRERRAVPEKGAISTSAATSTLAGRKTQCTVQDAGEGCVKQRLMGKGEGRRGGERRAAAAPLPEQPYLFICEGAGLNETRELLKL
ncbi:hypothetical protein EYF80_052375 [Liparis tanakae]|uniref:Uncharacterized protein n=1 Tax=Liparis tanakae TaxID=230148 RepID=A0A4Z2F8B9_9TELE|nr:hypothetical protein EYF80_052375 [Liparis tanakae]